MDEIRYYDRALNAAEVAALCNSFSNPQCGSWVNTPSESSTVKIGDLDISGNQLTVEVLANRTSFFSGGVETEGDFPLSFLYSNSLNYTF